MKIVKCDLCNKECTCSEIDVPVWHSNDISYGVLSYQDIWKQFGRW